MLISILEMSGLLEKLDKRTGTECLYILLCVFHESIKRMSTDGKIKW